MVEIVVVRGNLWLTPDTLAHPYLSQYLRGENGVADLRRVI